MKNVSTILLIILLGSACLGSMSFVTANSARVTSTTVIQTKLTESGYLYSREVDYWWVINVTEGDMVLLNIQTGTPFDWRSRLYYSNLTEIDTIKQPYTHTYQFIANETDDLLLELIASSLSFSYTIQCSHLVLEQTMMYTKSEHLSAREVDYWWVINVTEGDMVLLNIQTGTPFDWRSRLYYSNLTEIDTIQKPYTHIYRFIANQTDDYLLKLIAYGFSFSYTIECTHPFLWHDVAITDVTPDKTVVSQGELVKIYVNISNIGNFTETIYAVTAFYNSTPVETITVENLLPGETRPLEFVWNTTGTAIGNYTISAECGLIPLEINTANNKYTDGQVTVKSIPSKETEIAFSIDPNPAVIWQTVSLMGNLTTTDGDPIPGEQVTIKLNGIPKANLTTNSTGWFKASGQVGSAGTFNITVEYSGSIQYNASSDWEILVVNKARTEIYAQFVPNPVNSRETCMLKGILVDQFSNPIKFTTVTVEYSTDYGSTWNPAGTLTTNFYGIFSKTFTAPSPKTYLIRISYAGSPNYESSTAVEPLIVL